MYALRRREKFYCDWFLVPGDAGWKHFSKCYNLLMFESQEDAAMRRDKLQKIFNDVEMVELSDEELQAVTFMKLKHY